MYLQGTLLKNIAYAQQYFQTTAQSAMLILEPQHKV